MKWLLAILLYSVFHLVLLAQVASVAVPMPNQLTSNYRANGVTFRYPGNWKVKQEGANAQASIAPVEARLTAPAGQSFVTHGVIFGFFQAADSLDLDSSSDLLIQALHRSNSDFQKVPNKDRNTTITGRAGRVSSFTNFTEMSPEVGSLITVKAEHGLWFWIMFAPNRDYASYASTFTQIIESISFEEESRTTSNDQSAHENVVQRIVARLRTGKYTLPQFQVVITNGSEINAYADKQKQLVVLPIAIVHFLEKDEGELAFVVAHELGHLQDRNCEAIAGQVRITAEGRSRLCEERADELGFQYLTGAGYNPFDAAAEFGRMMMFYGGTGVLDSIFGRFMSDHPINQDRIGNLRKLLTQQCQNSPNSCRP
jgi:Zn-dependent protease with chaperone function